MLWVEVWMLVLEQLFFEQVLEVPEWVSSLQAKFHLGKHMKVQKPFLPMKAQRSAAWSWLSMFCWSVSLLKWKCSVGPFQFLDFPVEVK